LSFIRLAVLINEEGLLAVDAAGKVRWQFRQPKVRFCDAY
jgi:hypothetical protein